VYAEEGYIHKPNCELYNCPHVALFVGATSGIGKATLEQLVLASKGKCALKVYVIGRKGPMEHSKALLESLRSMNPDADLIWIDREVSLLISVKQICTELKMRESVLDLLFLSAGYAPWGGRDGMC
jgi:NADP-dependent 3-hydroxy acid dehydrogenase YdfG